eukprot:305451-Rhodomonas_salina.1
MYLRSVMQSLGFKQDSPTPVAEDNMACIYMLKSSVMFNKGKHIDVRVYRLARRRPARVRAGRRDGVLPRVYD